jgi:chloramphenicol O-acetyltransferase type A
MDPSHLIDLETWPRKAHYEHFRALDCPRWDLCSELDVTNFRVRCKDDGISFHHALIHAVTESVHAIEAFRYRIRGEHVVLLDRVHPRFTDMDKGSELFKLVTADFQADRTAFAMAAQAQAAAQAEPFPPESKAPRDDLVYLTCVPWLPFTRISHAWDLSKDDCVPRMAWGKFVPKGDRTSVAFAVEANHCFVDGLHMARFFEDLQTRLDA